MQLFLLGQTYSIFKPGQWRSRRRRRRSRKLRKLAVVGKLRISTGLSRDKTKPRDKTRALQRCDNNKTNIAVAAAAAAYKIIIIIVIISCCSCCCFSCIHTRVTSEISYGLFVNYLHFFASCRILRIRSVLARTTHHDSFHLIYLAQYLCYIIFFTTFFLLFITAATNWNGPKCDSLFLSLTLNLNLKFMCDFCALISFFYVFFFGGGGTGFGDGLRIASSWEQQEAARHDTARAHATSSRPQLLSPIECALLF